ncbi:MAG: tetratricopeptide (TPR) repeat protein [Pseudohongiellaceae bacterium]|jgi:tetratricopeptide (TPR) repeat protein
MKNKLKWPPFIVALLLLSISGLAIATDFQMPANIASSSESGGKSKKSLISKGTYKLLTKVQDAIDQNHYDEAFERLNKIILRVKDNAYESAVILKTAGYIYVSRQETSKALPLLINALGLNSLARENQQKLRYDIAQLIMNQQSTKQVGVGQQDVNVIDLQHAITYLTDWLDYATDKEITESVYARIGIIYIQLKQYLKASKYLNKAITTSALQGKKPSAYHHQLLLASYIKLNNFEAAIDTLKNLIVHFVKNKRYRMQLVGLYDETNQPKLALAVLEVSYKQGLLDDTTEYTALAQRLIQAGYPHKATRILNQGLDDFIVWVTPENLTLLASAYIQAKEPLHAIPILEKALSTATNARSGQLLSQLYIDQQNWKKTIDVLQRTLALANDKEAINLQLSLGYAYYEQGEIKEAKSLFNLLAENDQLNNQTKQTVKDWNKYLQ